MDYIASQRVGQGWTTFTFCGRQWRAPPTSFPTHLPRSLKIPAPSFLLLGFHQPDFQVFVFVFLCFFLARAGGPKGSLKCFWGLLKFFWGLLQEAQNWSREAREGDFFYYLAGKKIQNRLRKGEWVRLKLGCRNNPWVFQEGARQGTKT